jgi:hypothetical protein
MVISCINCGQQFLASEDLAGTSIPCSVCGKIMQLPAFEPIAPPLPLAKQKPLPAFRHPGMSTMQAVLVGGMVSWTVLALIYWVTQFGDVIFQSHDPIVVRVAMNMFLPTLVWYSVPMIAMTLGYIAAKR